MKKLLLCFLLTGCAASSPVLQPVPVDMPVSVACQTVPVEKPDFALSHINPMDTLAEKTRAALVEITQRKAYEAALQSQLISCQ